VENGAIYLIARYDFIVNRKSCYINSSGSG